MTWTWLRAGWAADLSMVLYKHMILIRTMNPEVESPYVIQSFDDNSIVRFWRRGCESSHHLHRKQAPSPIFYVTAIRKVQAGGRADGRPVK
ncbi:hypothetical protein A6R68_13666, partial [Neotoma lepida]